MFSEPRMDYDVTMFGWIYLMALSALFVILVKMVEDFTKTRRQDR